MRSYRRTYHAAIKVQQIIQTLAQEIQTKAHRQITRVVTKSLQFVFRKPYTFHIGFDRKRGKTQARLFYKLKGNIINPIEEDGGGLLDISAFALRLSCLMLATPKRRRWLALDEPFRNVNGEDYRQRTVELVDSLSHSFKIQIILATGMDWLRIGRIVEL